MDEVKLCLASWGFRDYALSSYFQTASELGIRSVEVSCDQKSVPLHLYPERDKQKVGNIFPKFESSVTMSV